MCVAIGTAWIIRLNDCAWVCKRGGNAACSQIIFRATSLIEKVGQMTFLNTSPNVSCHCAHSPSFSVIVFYSLVVVVVVVDDGVSFSS